MGGKKMPSQEETTDIKGRNLHFLYSGSQGCWSQSQLSWSKGRVAATLLIYSQWTWCIDNTQTKDTTDASWTSMCSRWCIMQFTGICWLRNKTKQNTKIFIIPIHKVHGFSKFYHVIACAYAATSLWKTHFFPAPAMKWKCAWFALLLWTLFFGQTFKRFAWNWKADKWRLHSTCDPTRTDQTWSRSSRFCRKSCFPTLRWHTSRFPPKSRRCQSSVLPLWKAALRHLGGSIVTPYLREFKWATCSDCSAGLGTAWRSTAVEN